MLVKKINERILGDEVFIAEEYRVREFALADVAADRGDVLVEEFGYFFNRVEAELEGHCFPMSSRILYSVLEWGLVFLFRNRQTVHGVLLILFAMSWMVRS